MNDNPRPRKPHPRNPRKNNNHLNAGSWNPFAGIKPHQAVNGVSMAAGQSPQQNSVGGVETSGGSGTSGGGGVLEEFVGNQGRSPYDGEVGGLDQRALNPAQEFQCYSEHATDLRMIDLRQVNGAFTALPYHYLETVDFIPTDGIVMKFSMATVKITGCRLHEVYRALLGYRVGFIQAVGNHFMPLIDDEDGEPAVEGIAIETPGSAPRSAPETTPGS
ncbi:MAG: hypothetical protein AAF086_05535 [Planctomycetota bacterium]